MEWLRENAQRYNHESPLMRGASSAGGGRDRLILCGGWKPAYPALKPGKSPRISANRRSDLDLPVKEEA
jgi:hypothetical protein